MVQNMWRQKYFFDTQIVNFQGFPKQFSRFSSFSKVLFSDLRLFKVFKVFNVRWQPCCKLHQPKALLGIFYTFHSNTCTDSLGVFVVVNKYLLVKIFFQTQKTNEAFPATMEKINFCLFKKQPTVPLDKGLQ